MLLKRFVYVLKAAADFICAATEEAPPIASI